MWHKYMLSEDLDGGAMGPGSGNSDSRCHVGNFQVQSNFPKKKQL